MKVSDSHHTRKVIAGCCMVLGPLAVLVAFIFSPPIHTNSGKQLAAFASHQDKLLFSTIMSLVAVTLFVGVTLGLMHMLREREVGYGHIGGALALVGFIASAAQAGLSLFAWELVRDGVQASDVTAYHGVTHDAAIVVPVFIFGFLPTIGLLILSVGMYRAKAVDWWMATAIGLGAVAIGLSYPLESVVVGVIGGALMVIGVGSLGLMVLSETDADWQHTPEYHGLRPAAGTS